MSGAPVGAPDAPATPTPAALRNAITCSCPSKPARSGVAVMLAFVSFAVARAVQTSATPACESLRLTSDQVSPPPVTVVALGRRAVRPVGADERHELLAGRGRGQRRSPSACRVAWRVTLVSIEIVAGGGALLSTVTLTDAESPTLPAASVASAVRMCVPGSRCACPTRSRTGARDRAAEQLAVDLELHAGDADGVGGDRAELDDAAHAGCRDRSA